jgi:hypothetical protein
MPELLLRQAPVPLMASAVGTTGSPGTNVDLDELCQLVVQWTYAVEF